MAQSGRNLTRREFEEVMRRAAELAAADPGASDLGLSETEVLHIAGEVGLPERHVRAALAELRSAPVSGGAFRALFGSPLVAASRIVPQSRDRVARALDEFMVAGQLLQPVRRTPDLLVYWPAVDWVSQIARAASSTTRRYYVASARKVEIRLEGLDPDRTVVEFEVDPGTRNNNLAGGITGALAVGAVAGVGVGIALPAALPLAWAVGGGVGLAIACGAPVLWAVGRHHRRQNHEVRMELEGILDQLEQGQALEPPPPSWRRWVRRHFGGVAREMLRGGANEE